MASAQKFAPLEGPGEFGTTAKDRPPQRERPSAKASFEVEGGDNFENPLRAGPAVPVESEEEFVNAEISEMEEQQAKLKDKNGNPIYESVALDWCMVLRMDRKNPDDLPLDARELCARLFEAGLYVKHHIGVRRNELYLQVGATDEMLMHEATHYMDLPMQIKGPRPMNGTVKFHEELTRHFTSKVGAPFSFNSGQRQRIVMSILKRKAMCDPYIKALSPKRDTLLKKAIQKSQKGKDGEPGRGLQRWAMKELLEANGCSMSELSREKMEETLPVCMEFYKAILEEDENEVQKQGSSNPGARVDVEGQLKVIAELQTKGVKSFQGEMITAFPLHDEDEIAALSERWANWSLMWRWTVPASETADGEEAKGGMFHQPIEDVRDYFGDHVALYFAWLGLYTRWLRGPAIIGAFVMLGNFVEGGIDKNPLTMGYSIFLSLWSTLFIEAWKNRETQYRFCWGSEGHEVNEKPRPQFRGAVKIDDVTKSKMLVQESDAFHYFQVAVSTFITVTLVLATVVGAYLAFAIRTTHITEIVNEQCTNSSGYMVETISCTHRNTGWMDHPSTIVNGSTDCTTDYHLIHAACGPPDLVGHGKRDETGEWKEACEAYSNNHSSCVYTEFSFKVDGEEVKRTFWNEKKWKLVSSVVNLILIQGGGQAYERIAGKLNQWENHRTQTEYTDSLILKAFGFQFVNNYFTLFYIAFLIHIEMWEGMKTGCDGRSCMAELQFQLLIVFSGKTIVKKIVEMLKPYVRATVKSFAAKRVAQAAAKAKDLGAAAVSVASGGMVDLAGDNEGQTFKHPAERQRWLDPYGDKRFPGTFYDFKDVAIQFGYVTLFAASFPVAALFALCNNIFEIRSDAFLLCRSHQRPPWQAQEDIGSWGSVLIFVSVVNTMCNACLTGFVGAQMQHWAGLSDDATFMDRVFSAKLWMLVILIEHGVLCCKFIVKIFIPDEPDWMGSARDALEYRKQRDLMPESMRTELQQQEAQFNAHNSRADEIAELLRMYKHADKDGDGNMSSGEFREMLKSCKHLGPDGLDLNDEDFAAFWKTVDMNHSGVLDYEEIERWFTEQETLKDPPDSGTKSPTSRLVGKPFGLVGSGLGAGLGAVGGIGSAVGSSTTSAFGRASIKKRNGDADNPRTSLRGGGGPDSPTGELV